jgi:D-glycero-D-manno-heptose 1,7-bisphosphate phosphatase
MFKKKDCEEVHNFILKKFKKEKINFKEIFYCPHSPEDKCLCRKPGIEMLIKAAKKYDIALARSWMIGDKLSDIEAGKMSNCKTILLGEISDFKKVRSVEHPDFVISKISEIKKIIK